MGNHYTMRLHFPRNMLTGLHQTAVEYSFIFASTLSVTTFRKGDEKI